MKHPEFDILVNITKADMSVLNAVFVQARNGESTRPKAVAGRFTNASTQKVTAHMKRLHRAGALAYGSGDLDWARPTEAGVAAMRLHFRKWREVFSEADERAALGEEDR